MLEKIMSEAHAATPRPWEVVLRGPGPIAGDDKRWQAIVKFQDARIPWAVCLDEDPVKALLGAYEDAAARGRPDGQPPASPASPAPRARVRRRHA